MQWEPQCFCLTDGWKWGRDYCPLLTCCIYSRVAPDVEAGIRLWGILSLCFGGEQLSQARFVLQMEVRAWSLFPGLS